jgi:hypothetical protein
MKDFLQLDKFMDWLKTQPGDTQYRYISISDCVVARYLKAQDVKFRYVGPAHVTGLDGRERNLPVSMIHAALGDGPGEKIGEKLLRENDGQLRYSDVLRACELWQKQPQRELWQKQPQLEDA